MAISSTGVSRSAPFTDDVRTIGSISRLPTSTACPFYDTLQASWPSLTHAHGDNSFAARGLSPGNLSLAGWSYADAVCTQLRKSTRPINFDSSLPMAACNSAACRLRQTHPPPDRAITTESEVRCARAGRRDRPAHRAVRRRISDSARVDIAGACRCLRAKDDSSSAESPQRSEVGFSVPNFLEQIGNAE